MILSDSAQYASRRRHVLLYLLGSVAPINGHRVAGEAKGKLEKKNQINYIMREHCHRLVRVRWERQKHHEPVSDFLYSGVMANEILVLNSDFHGLGVHRSKGHLFS